MNLIEEYRQVVRDMTVISSKLKRLERAQTKLQDVYKPSGLSGIDYTRVNVQVSSYIPDFMEVAEKIYSINEEMDALRTELKELEDQREMLDQCIEFLGDTQIRVIRYKIRGYSNNQIAALMHYTPRHISRLCKQMQNWENDVYQMTKNM